jgi:RNA polymerase sigma factor (sigma-70 family)
VIVSDKVVELLTAAQKERVRRAIALVEKRAKAQGRLFAGLIDPEELETDGKIVVLEKVRRYDEKRDGTFEGYIVKAIDGRMKDLIRAAAIKKRIHREVQIAYLLVRGYREEYNLLRETDEALEGRLADYCGLITTVGFMGGAQRASLEEDTAKRGEYARVMEALREAVAELSEGERAVLGAMLVDGMTLEEAADFLGISSSAAWRRLQRARICLKRELLRRGVRQMLPPRDVEGVDPVLRSVGAKSGERRGEKRRKP